MTSFRSPTFQKPAVFREIGSTCHLLITPQTYRKKKIHLTEEEGCSFGQRTEQMSTKNRYYFRIRKNDLEKLLHRIVQKLIHYVFGESINMDIDLTQRHKEKRLRGDISLNQHTKTARY